MNYTITYQEPNKHFIHIKFETEVNSDFTEIHLPAWRPGRYELGNFAKNIGKWKAYNENGEELNFKKTSKDCWNVDTKNCKRIRVEYTYYANEINAGSSYIGEDHLYFNGVNLFLYIKEKMGDKCSLTLNIPENFIVATGLKSTGKNTFEANDFHELVDCPVIASPNIIHDSYEVNNTTFHLWFQGDAKPNFERIKNDFIPFTESQLKAMKEFPFEDYHFMFEILSARFYHGVEHCNSTVIALGPSHDLMKGWYEELLGVSSHELFHAWNIKKIRPIEMMPYDYSKENYTRLGYLAEGITTYYGDLFLLRSKTFSFEQYKKTFDQLLERHYSNFGRFNLSVANSSFDTWLDGYNKGIPNRKVSIYTEGALCAFITDVWIRKKSNNEKSLDDLMRTLYFEYAKKNKGVSEADFITEVTKLAREEIAELFENLYYGVSDFSPYLKNALSYLGLELKEESINFAETFMGVKTIEQNGKTIVNTLYPDCNAEKIGLSWGDEIVSINNKTIHNDFNSWCEYFKDEKEVTLGVNKPYEGQKNILLTIDKNNSYYKRYSVEKHGKTNDETNDNFDKWSN